MKSNDFFGLVSMFTSFEIILNFYIYAARFHLSRVDVTDLLCTACDWIALSFSIGVFITKSLGNLKIFFTFTNLINSVKISYQNLLNEYYLNLTYESVLTSKPYYSTGFFDCMLIYKVKFTALSKKYNQLQIL